MTDLITKQELIDAKADAQDLGDVVNGAADLNGNGTVPTRTGGSKKTLSRALADIQNNSRALYTSWATLAAITDRLNGATAEVPPTDAATHASLAGDVGASGGQTPNSGVFNWVSGTGWVRVGAFLAPQLAAAGNVTSTTAAAAPANIQAALQYSGFPDQFFRRANLTSGTWLNRHRWWRNSLASAVASNGLALMAGTQFRGNMIRVTGTGSDLQGPAVLLEDFGTWATGDKFTVYVLATVSAGTLSCPGYWTTGPSGITGSQQNPTNDAAGATLGVTATPRWLRFDLTAPAGVSRFAIAPYVSSGGQADIHAIWAFKGVASAGPDWPALQTQDQEARLAMTEAVAAWRGKKSLWADPYFRSLSYPSATVNGALAWGLVGSSAAQSGMTSWTVVDAAFYDGKALRKTGDATFTGPRINLAGTNVVPGTDSISIGMQVCGVAGQTSTPNLAFRCYDSNNSPTTTQLACTFVDGTSGGLSPTTPILATATFAVPANTAYIQFYPVNGNAAHAFDIVALWAVKGTSLPQVPPPNEDVATWVAELRSTDALLATRVTFLEGGSNFAFVGSTKVTPTGTTVLNGSSFAGVARDLVFSGAGARYSPAGVTFNAIEVAEIKRTPGATGKWKTLNVVVRTGANSHLSGSTLVAVGSSVVDPSADTLNNVRIVLRDPTTNAPISLSDASFSGGEYFIGVYALDLAGAPAACGYSGGTMPNSLNSSWYLTTQNPKTASWASDSGNPQIGFRHLSITSPVESLDYDVTQAMADKVAAKMGLASQAPDLVTPPAVYGLEGQECNVYLDNLMLVDFRDYEFSVRAAEAVSKSQEERWTWVPAGALTSGNLSITCRRRFDGVQLVAKTIAQRAAAASAGSGLNKKVLVIGDSLVNAGTITQTLVDLAGPDVMDITLLGTRGSGANKNEGRGGYTINDYATAGRTYYDFTVSGVTVPPALNAAEYTNNGSTFRVQEVSLSGGAGTIRCSLVSGSGTRSGSTLTKSNGAAGDATITFSASAAVSGNPWWIGGALDFAGYLTANSIAVPDWVIIQLGTNDAFGQTTDAGVVSLASSELTKLDALIANIKAAGANVKVALALIPPPSSSQDSFGANYNTSYDKWRVKRNYAIWTREMIAKYTGLEASRTYLIPSGMSVDTVNNYPREAAAPVNSRNTAVQVQRQSNSVHPATSGYQQIADAWWAFLKYYAAVA